MKMKRFWKEKDEEINKFVEKLVKAGNKVSIRPCGAVMYSKNLTDEKLGAVTFTDCAAPILVTWHNPEEHDDFETKKFETFVYKLMAKQINNEDWKELKNAKQRTIYLSEKHNLPTSKADDLINVKTLMDKGLI